jgi:WD40 repeat protein
LTVRAPKDADDYVEPPPLDFAPDGARLAVADNSPRIIELQTGRAIVKIAGEGKSFAKVRFSPDGGWLAAIDEERKTVVFDAATGKAATRIDGELYWRASPKGDAQQAAVLFDQAVETGELDRSGTWRSSRRLTPQDYSPQARDDENFSAARELSPDGHNIATLVTRNDVSQLTVTSLDTGKPLSRALGAPAGLSKLVWSPRGAYLAAVSLFGFHVVDTRSLKTAAQTDSGLEITVEDAAFDPGEALLATTDRGGQVILWDIAKNAKAATLSGPGERVYDPIFSASGDLLSAHYGNTSRVLLFAVSDAMQASDPEVSTKPLATFDPIWGGAKVARFTRDGSGLVIVYEGRKLAFWRTGHWRWRHRLPLQYEARYEAGIPEGLRDLRVTADGAAIGVMSGGNWRGWNIVSGKETSDSAKGLRTLDKFTLSEFGQLKLRVDASEETTANLEDRSDGRQKYPLQHSAQVMSKAFSPDGSCILTTSRFYSASGDPPENADVARLWDTETGALMREWSFGYGNPDSALFAGSDHIVVLSGGEALVYETPLCQPLDSLRQQARIRVPSP